MTEKVLSKKQNGMGMMFLLIGGLLLTIAGAGVVLYAVNTLTPVVVQSGVVATPAANAQEIFDAVPHDDKEMAIIPIASHFDMYDLAPFVSEAFDYILPFFGKNL